MENHEKITNLNEILIYFDQLAQIEGRKFRKIEPETIGELEERMKSMGRWEAYILVCNFIKRTIGYINE